MITKRKKLLFTLLLTIIASAFLITCSSSAKLPLLTGAMTCSVAWISSKPPTIYEQ